MIERLSPEETRRLEKLAASMAHEIKNPLAGISSTVQVLAGKLPSGDRRQECIAIILEEIKRLERILDRFRMLAAPVKPVKREIDLNEIIEKVIFLEQEAFERAEISVDYAAHPKIGRLLADHEQIKQVLLNLLINARNALNKSSSAKISVRIHPEADAVTIYVKDNGPGVSPENQDAIFEPFFSTMPKGVGLGLAISRQILREHGGDLTCSSQPGHGAAFAMTIPRQ